ncbi:hypothetical protein ACE41H_17785, partial [Paenibacillus enshidis]
MVIRSEGYTRIIILSHNHSLKIEEQKNINIIWEEFIMSREIDVVVRNFIPDAWIYSPVQPD